MPVEVRKKIIQSSPPARHLKVKNIYVNADTGKLVVDYDDKPVN